MAKVFVLYDIADCEGKTSKKVARFRADNEQQVWDYLERTKRFRPYYAKPYVRDDSWWLEEEKQKNIIDLTKE